VTLSSMWTSVLVLAMAVNFEPIRIGLIALMLSGARPMLQLLAFIIGSFAMSISVGFPVLFVFHHGLFGVTNTDGSKAQIVIGVLILLIAVLLTTNFPAGRFARRPTTPLETTAMEQMPTKKLSARARSLLRGGSPWLSGVMGMSAALPSVDYMALLVLIAASGATPVTQAGALLTFIVVANTLAAIPLGSYLIAPAKTGALLGRFHHWIRARRRRDFAALLAMAGCIVLALGITGL
jgi:Sap, sulfolipid-1-addressing protein